jgi:putative FmdB family regulatory protein
MPTYDFICPECKRTWEIHCSVDMRDKLNMDCPDCNKKLERRFVMPLAVNWGGKFHDPSMQKMDYDGLGPTW